MPTEIEKMTEAVVAHHVQSLFSGNLDAVMQDYSRDAVLCTPNGSCVGLEAIRETFTGLLKVFSPEVVANLKVIRQDINGEYCYALWSAPPAVAFGGDTFHVRDGKIIMQTFVGQMG